MTSLRLFAVIIAVNALSIVTAHAASLPLRVDVSANVPPNCRLTVSPLSFGTYDPLVSHSTVPADAATILVVNCTRNTGASVSFDFGTLGSGDGRVMAGPGRETLRYQIYSDSARSRIWGQGAESIVFVSSGIYTPEQLTVFGRIPPRQEVEPGAYADVLTATVDF